MISSIDFQGFDRVECRPAPDGNGSACRTRLFFHVEGGAADDRAVHGSVDSPWGEAWFDFVTDGDGDHSWAVSFFDEGACEEGMVGLYGYLELVDEYDETSAVDHGTDTVRLRCVAD